MMKRVIRFGSKEELRALPILLRHSPATGLPDRTYVVSPEAAQALRAAGIPFTELGSDCYAPSLKGDAAGERI
jgi:hypothetical protein